MSAGSFTVTGFEAFERRFNPKSTMDRVEKAMDSATEAGREAMREAVETRGTGKTWKTPWRGRAGSFPGRVDSGHMLDEVKGEVTERTAHSVSGIVGWEDGSEMYIALQDQGFRHVLTGQDVEGMMALRDGSEIAKRALISDLEDIVRDI